MIAAAGGAMPVDPMAAAPAPMGPIPGMPSTDPNVIAQLRAADHAALDAAQDSAMQMAAQQMGGASAPLPGDPAAAAMGAGPLPGDPMALGAPVPPPMMGLPPELAAAFGGPDMGSLESESITPLPGEEFAGELGGY